MTVPGFARIGQRLICLALCGGMTGACVKRLPAQPTPAPVAPQVNAAAPAEGSGRLVVDVVQGPTRVHRVHMQARPIDHGQGRVRYRFYEVPSVLCGASPCVVDVPVGTNVLLGFPVLGDPGAMEVELVHVGPEAAVYRRALSVYTRKKKGGWFATGIVGTVLGAAGAATGVTLLPLGLKDDNDALTTAGAVSLVGGAVVMTVGIMIIRRYSNSYRPGSSIHFPLGVGAR